VARRLGLHLVDVTFSGATTHEFVTRSKRPAQIAAVTESTWLITLAGGGNDVGFAPRILLSSLPGPMSEVTQQAAEETGAIFVAAFRARHSRQSRTRAPRRTTTPRTSRVMAARRECST
jgi:hypothetical protein